MTPQDPGRPLCVVGEHIILLAAGEAAGGDEIFLQAGPAGTGPIPHSHPWDGSFYVSPMRFEENWRAGHATKAA